MPWIEEYKEQHDLIKMDKLMDSIKKTEPPLCSSTGRKSLPCKSHKLFGKNKKRKSLATVVCQIISPISYGPYDVNILWVI